MYNPEKWHCGPDAMPRNSSAMKKELLPGIYHIISSHIDFISYADTKPDFPTTIISHLEDLSQSVITYQHIQPAAREDTDLSNCN